MFILYIDSLLTQCSFPSFPTCSQLAVKSNDDDEQVAIFIPYPRKEAI